MLRSIFCAVSVVTVVSGGASANLGTFSQSQAFSGELSPFSTALVFDQINQANSGVSNPDFIVIFDVTLKIEATMSVNAAVENESAEPNDGVGVSMSGFVSASGETLWSDTTFFVLAASGPLGPSDGVPGSGPDFHDFGLLSASGSGIDGVFSGFAPFIGSGTFVVDVLATGGIAFSSGGAVSTSLSDFSIEGVVTVEMNYILIPAPSTLCVMAGGLLLVRRRR